MTTTVNNNESKVLKNRIGFCGSFYKFLGEDIKIGNQIHNHQDIKFDYQIILDDGCKNGHLTFSFTGSIKIKKGNGRYYDFISGAIGDIITYFKPELSMFEKLHLCNHLGQPTYIDNIRYHINEGKTDREISEMYNIPDIKAIEILRNASDNKDLFYYLVFRLGIADTWEKLAAEAIREIEERSGYKLKIIGKDRVFKQFSEKDCEVLENLYQLGYASKVQKELRSKARKEDQKQKELKEIEEERNKAIAIAQKEYEIKKKAVVSFGISWNNIIFYNHSNKLCFNYSDCYKKILSDLINEFICTNVLPEGINVVNGDIGTAKNIRSIVLYDEIGKIVVFFEDGEKRECLFDGENILQSVLKEM